MRKRHPKCVLKSVFNSVEPCNSIDLDARAMHYESKESIRERRERWETFRRTQIQSREVSNSLFECSTVPRNYSGESTGTRIRY